MNKTVAIVLGVAAIVAIGVVAWLLWPNSQVDDSSTNTNTPPSQSTTPPSSSNNEVPPSSSGDEVESEIVEVDIQDSAFSPNSVTVKKGTKVVWTNKDNIGHNVVSDSDSPAGGPPTEAPLLSNGQTFEFTFDTVGTFTYHCTPHPFMQGSVTVVE